MRPLSTRSLIAALLFVFGLALVGSTGPAAVRSAPLPEGTERLAAALDAEAMGPRELNRYIVVLDEPSLASYRGGIAGLAPTAVDTAGGKVIQGKPSVHLDFESPAAKAYLAYLERRQDRAIRMLSYVAPELDANDWRYTNVLNGFAAKMTPQSAAAALRLDGIRLIYPTQELIPEMDSTKDLIGTVHAWEAAGGTAEAGLNARVAILEAGNATLHEFFSDEGMPDPPEGFPSAEVYTSGNGEVTDILAMSANPTALVNNKIIGYRIFTGAMSQAAMQSYANGFGKSGHGSHVSGTVGGRHGSYEILPGLEVEMGGVAPNAWVFNYPVFGDTGDMVKAMEVMAEEEIDAVNLSLGTSTWLMDRPETHPVGVAMSGAADAGVLVVGSAGNAGSNGRTSLSGGWKYSEDLMVVGNTTSTGRTFLGIELEDAPEELLVLAAGLRGARYPEPITAELVFRDDGGCELSDEVVDKIAVVERFGPGGSTDPIGPCGYTARAQFMADSGAVGIIYVYYDRATGGGSGTQLALPATALGLDYGPALVEWMKEGNTTTATMNNVETRDYLGTPDMLAASSSRGPGIDWTIKPDISAPGTGIVSSVLTDANTQDDLPPDVSTWPAYTGTSMSAPHITGSAGLLRSMHPDWTVQQLRSAMINTSLPVVTTGSGEDMRPADPTEGGPGRINLTDAHDPRAFLHPPKASFGSVAAGDHYEMEIVLESASEEAITWDLSIEPGAGDAEIHIDPESITLAAGMTATLSIELHTDDITEAEHYGDIVLQERAAPPAIYMPMLSNGEAEEGGILSAPVAVPDALDHDGEDHGAELRSLRLVYYAYADLAENRDNVLIIDWTYDETEDYTSYYTDALDELGLTWSIWGLGEEGEHAEGVAQTTHPTFEAMFNHDLVILNANESQRGLLEAGLSGGFQYMNTMLGGGNFLIAGQGVQGWWRYLSNGTVTDTPANRLNYPDTFPHVWQSASQNVGCEMCLARYFMGYTPVYTATLSNRLLVPFPTAPDMPEKEVVLAPHTDADGPFDYSLDISTGGMAKDGAAGNQYQFNSGQVITGHQPNQGNDPSTPENEANKAASLGDILDTLIVQRTIPAAKPLWSYPVMISTTQGMTDTVNVVGTYVAGKHHDEGPAWNGMYWGFGLEGVGKGGEDTASRSQLLGDTFNFMAMNMNPDGGLVIDAGGKARLTVDLGPKAAPVRFTGARIDWGDGRVEKLDFSQPSLAGELDLTHAYGSVESAEARGDVIVTLTPVRGEAAPVTVKIRAGSNN